MTQLRCIVPAMRKPEVALENYKAVYDYYTTYRPNPIAARIGHALMSSFYRAELAYAPGAEATTKSLLAKGTGLVIPANHFTDRDQYVYGTMAQRSKTLHAIRGHTSIAAKPPVFLKSDLQRRAVDIMGAVPAFRTKDIFAGAERNTRDTSLVSLQRAGSQALREMLVAKLDAGEHVAHFPEGERNKVNPLEVQPLKIGIGDMLCAVAPDTPVAILPAGFYYPQEEVKDKNGELAIHWDYTHPAIYLGKPLTQRFEEPQAVIATLQPAMQECLDGAVQMIRDRQ